ncbi:MAG TPA: tRNA guanosine(34) transglycosylase Tgt [Candidatus Paceibacterota bacterium]|nr:tRNA guanosine(34) transglycosylase Tgt [Candidatus Paceibacterota bacterium]
MPFTIIKKDKKTKARLGLLKTPHGTVKTPAYVFVGTYGRFLHLTPKDLKKAATQIVIANTFHLWQKALENKISEGFIHKSFGLKIPIMTDSGGFQVLSLAFGDKNKVGKFMTGDRDSNLPASGFARPIGTLSEQAPADLAEYKRTKIKINQKGVYFTYDGKKRFLGPELSMDLQSKIGADIMFAFDCITSPLDDYDYNKKALELTNKWAKICLTEHAKLQKPRKNKQMLYGIVQGGVYPDLREESAKAIGAMPFDGFGIGGSYTKEQIAAALGRVTPHLPEEKPRHLLGVGKVADVFEAVEQGMDTFDCVIPTREARHGRLYTRQGTIDIRQGKHTVKTIIEKGCKCPTCAAKVSKEKIRELIKSQDRILNAKGQRYCLMHNMWFFNTLLEEIRAALARGSYRSYKTKFLKKFSA